MGKTLHAALFCALTVPAAAAIGPADASAASAVADGDVAILVLREHGVGSAAHAQKYLDKVVAHTATLNGWSGATGKYLTRRSKAKGFIAEAQPKFGIMTLGAFLSLRTKHKLEVIGSADVKGAGGRKYHVVSVDQPDLAACKGLSLATNHGTDGRFIDKVVAGGDFTLADFMLVHTRRPLQTVKKITRDEARCALIDDAQLADLGNVEGGTKVKTLWSSAELPPMAVVAFPTATKPEVKTFRGTLDKVCAGEGASACADVGIAGLRPASAKDYKAVVKAYGS